MGLFSENNQRHIWKRFQQTESLCLFYILSKFAYNHTSIITRIKFVICLFLLRTIDLSNLFHKYFISCIWQRVSISLLCMRFWLEIITILTAAMEGGTSKPHFLTYISTSYTKSLCHLDDSWYRTTVCYQNTVEDLIKQFTLHIPVALQTVT